MKSKTLYWDFILILILIGGLLLIQFGFQIRKDPGSISETIYGNELFSYSLDSLSVDEYILMQDSIKRLYDYKKWQLKDEGSGLSLMNTIGAKLITECDSCIAFGKSPPQKQKYYLELPGYELKNGSEFEIEFGKYFIKHPVWDKE
jgi:hypothetical protein